jgi:hypothetical protein
VAAYQEASVAVDLAGDTAGEWGDARLSHPWQHIIRRQSLDPLPAINKAATADLPVLSLKGIVESDTLRHNQ